MNFRSFTETLTLTSPPTDLNIYLISLWYDAKGDWDKAHELINDLEDTTAAWVHAYLHRKEGDKNNAAYWYRRAGKPVCVDSLENEWVEITNNLLSR